MAVGLASGDFTPRAFCPGFLRGLALHNNHAVVGLSLSRDGSFSGLALDDEMKKRDADGWCGVQIVSLASGDIVQWIRIEGAVTRLSRSRRGVDLFFRFHDASTPGARPAPRHAVPGRCQQRELAHGRALDAPACASLPGHCTSGLSADDRQES